MPSLSDTQTNFIETINDGPERLDPMLFAGPPDRVLLGLMAHANTISHARIVALEETFPLTRQHFGDAVFNALARDFVETRAARACDANRIGLGFPDYLGKTPFVLSLSSRRPPKVNDSLDRLHFDKLSANGVGIEADTRELAAIEWAWLESYHAAEAKPLMLPDLGELSETALLALPVAPHPTARIVDISSPIASVLQELAGQQPAAILCVRPDAEVQLVPLDAVQRAVFAASAGKSAALGNLLAAAIEQAGEQALFEPILHLIGAGALVKAG